MLFARYAGCKVAMQDEEHVIMGESDVLGIKGGSVSDLKPLEVRSASHSTACTILRQCVAPLSPLSCGNKKKRTDSGSGKTGSVLSCFGTL